MKILKGISVSSGIARGIVCVYANEIEEILPHYLIEDSQVPFELKRLREAIDIAKKEMEELTSTDKMQLDEEIKKVFNAHLSILSDENLYRKISGMIKNKNINSEHAVSDVFDEYIKKFESKDNHFREIANDFVDIRNRVIGAFGLETGRFKCEIGDRKSVIVASKRLTTSMVMNISKEKVLAFVTKDGGFTNHATILARSYGVPNIYGVDIENNLHCGDSLIVDGSMGKVIISPDEKTTIYYDKKIKTLEQKKTYCELIKDFSPATKDGEKIQLKVNISMAEEIDYIKKMPHDGIGLLRTEFLFAQKDSPPSEEEQYRVYKRILDENSKKPVSIRVLDIGLDKMPLYFEKIKDGDIRGAIAVESFPDIYITQAKALLRANTHSNMRLIYPMVSDLNDLRTFRQIFISAAENLKKESIKFNNKEIKEGIMIETPSAVMMAEELLKEVDFINIGSNDLLQYSLAAFRDNPLAENRYHILHPSLVKLMKIVTEAGIKAKKEVCLCGEIAFFEEFYELFLLIGLRSFSVAVTKFSDIKCQLMNINIDKDKSRLKEFYKMDSIEKIEKYFAFRS